MKKRFLLWLMAVAMPMVAWCADGDKFTKELDEGITMTFKVISEAEKTCQVGDGSNSSIDKSYNLDLVVPKMIEGYKVVSIGRYAFSNCNVAKITLQSGIKDLQDDAFYYCKNLQELTLPNGLETIGEMTFWYCSSLTELHLPNTVKSIGKNCFYYNSKLTTMTFGESLETIADNAFNNCSLIEVRLPKTLKSIGNNAFKQSKNLISLIVESGELTYIGNMAFYQCTRLQTVTFAPGTTKGTTTMGYDVFKECSSLTSVVLPTTLSNIGNMAFYYDTNLTSITIPDGVTLIDESAFYYNAFSSMIIPNSVQTIKSAAFNCCTNLEEVVLPEGLTELPSSLFSNCYKLSSLTIPQNVVSIGGSVIANTLISEITIPSKVETIEKSAFSYATNLISITFDNCYPSIGTNAFYYCKNLSNVYYPACADNLFTMNSPFKNNSTYPTLHPMIKLNNEWETYCATASFDVPEGIEAYVVESYDKANGKAVLKKVTTINNRQGLLLKTTMKGTLIEMTPNSSVIEYETNMLKGVIKNTIINETGDAGVGEGDLTNLLYHEGQFYKAVDGSNVPVYTAYLQVPTADLKGDEPSIETVIDPVPDDPSTRKCATPVITYEGGQLKLACETQNVEFKTTIKSVDVKTHYTENIAIGGQYSVTAIATKAGYLDSDEATLEISLKGSDVEGDLNGDKEVTITDAVKVVNIILNK